MSDIEAASKAIEKTAEFGTQVLQTSEKAGGFLARVFKEPIEEGMGILTDQLRLIRLRRWVVMADELDVLLTARGVQETRAVPPKLGVPLLEHASLEDEPELSAMWVELLANAMDPNFNGELRVAYTEIIKNLSPTDALVLKAMADRLRNTDCLNVERVSNFGIAKSAILRRAQIDDAAYLISIENLIRQRCAAPRVTRLRPGKSIKLTRGDYLTTDSGTDCVVMTPLGFSFMLACTSGVGMERDTGKLQWAAAGDGEIDAEFSMTAANL